MIFMGDWSAEKREDPVAGGLHNVTVVAAHRVDHQLERRIDDRARFFRIEILLELRRALDIGEQRGDRLSLAVARVTKRLLGCDSYPVFRCTSRLDGAGRLARKSGTASVAESCAGAIQCTA